MLVFDLLGGTVIGGLVGLLGAGGSVLTVPLLAYGAHMPLREAGITSLVIVLFSATAALLPRLRLVRWRLALIMGAVGVPCTYAGNQLGHRIGNSMLGLCFATVMLFAAVMLLRSPRRVRHSGPAVPGADAGVRGLIPAVAAGAGVGTLSGLLGIGGGFLLVPVLTLVLGMDITVAIGTELVVVVINSMASIVGHLSSSMRPHWSQALVLAAVAVLSSLVVSRIAARVPDRILRRSFAAIVLTVAGYMAFTALTPILFRHPPGLSSFSTQVRRKTPQKNSDPAPYDPAYGVSD